MKLESNRGRIVAGIVAGALVATGAFVAPAVAATEQTRKGPVKRAAPRGVGSFTPSAADPRLAALFARREQRDRTSGHHQHSWAGRAFRGLLHLNFHTVIHTCA